MRSERTKNARTNHGQNGRRRRGWRTSCLQQVRDGQPQPGAQMFEVQRPFASALFAMPDPEPAFGQGLRQMWKVIGEGRAPAAEAPAKQQESAPLLPHRPACVCRHRPFYPAGVRPLFPEVRRRGPGGWWVIMIRLPPRPSTGYIFTLNCSPVRTDRENPANNSGICSKSRRLTNSTGECM